MNTKTCIAGRDFGVLLLHGYWLSPGRGASSPSGYGLCCPARHYESPVLPGTRSPDQTVTSPARQGVGQAE
jgi:hypothetical protein